MDDYIKREDAVVYAISLIDRIYEGTVAPRDIRKEVKQQVINEMNSTEILPAANVRENVPAEWLDDEIRPMSDPRLTCSNCGSIETPLVKWRFCPRCGADMRGEKEGGSAR